MKPSKREQLHEQQNGLCAYCHKPLSVGGAHRHHLDPERDDVEALELVHPGCHRKIHAEKAKSGKARR